MSSMDSGDPYTTTFPRIELPPVPTFAGAAPATEVAEGEVAPLRDEPLGTWQPPFAPSFSPEEQYRAMVERVATLSAAAPVAGPLAVPAPLAAPAPVVNPVDTPVADLPARTTVSAPPDTVVPVMPELAPAPELAPHRTSRVALGLLVVLAIGLLWASRMAFSPGLMALAGLLYAQLAAAAAAAGSRTLAIRVAVPAVAVSLVAIKGALGAFSEMAMTAGLFVLVAGLPALLVLGAVQLILRRRGDRASTADVALRDGWKLRFGALAALLVAAFVVRDSFSAKPDAFVTFGIVALVAITLLGALRARSAD
jgi:hypothetical protein